MTSLFTTSSSTDGKFGHGNLPPELSPLLDPLAQLFLVTVPPERLTDSTHHQWCRQSSPELRQLVETVKNHPVWEQLSDGTDVVVRDLHEMDELYYSRAPRERRRLYAAAANYDLHTDGVFAFPGVRVYRVLIGLTDNDHVETQFPRLQVRQRIGKGDFVVFDFDRAMHRVVRLPDGPDDGYRILLKLHFAVSRFGRRPVRYVGFVLQTYRIYEALTRMLMDAGTDPRTLPQFGIGSLGQFVVRRPRLFRLCAVLPLLAVVLHWLGHTRISTVLFGTIVLALGGWVGVTGFRYARFRLFGVR